MARSLKVAVVGAGVSGLVTARELQREGQQVVVYEKSNQIGGTWVYSPQVESDPLSLDPKREIVHSSLYYSLETNLPRRLMGFSDYPFTIRKNGELRTFPGHQEVLQFLNNFVQDFGLLDLIRFNTEVVRVEQQNDQWVVESRRSTCDELSSSEEIFEAVVVCNGHYTIPKVADLPGIKSWPGKQIHSHNYRVPEPFRDQVVIVIGAGPSAMDIGQEITKVAKEVHLSSRSPEIKVSKLEMFNNLWQHSKIEYCYENGLVAFQDGTSVAADIILHCTGYKYDFYFLRTNDTVTIDENRVGPLYKHVFPPVLAPGLSFVGLPYRAVTFFMIEVQAKWVASVLSGKVVLPPKEEMLHDVEQHYRLLEENRIPKHHTHRLPLDPFEYLNWVAAQVRFPVDTQLPEIYHKFIEFICGASWIKFREQDVESWIN
ncbi:flavin-containing monooxygenase FMO GS-OX5-like [Coffea arabica]|uniref:Flavin-containing monooxygenase n=1 Tax=Coffea arabica TaxID=13443 RepID=A0A6P6VTU2_COFAR|nr:flavin-containing monooxygenase FMO GS-OX5-like [Coffea arabica]